jgi:APA family basic amino acid/polyamine antiporter
LEQFGVKILTIVALTVFSVISYRSTKLSSSIQVIFAFAKVAAIFLLVGGLFFSGKGDWHNLIEKSSMIQPAGFAMVFAFVAACNGALQALDGANNLLYVTGEIKNPGNTIPRSLFVGLLSCVIIYVVINSAMMYVLPVDKMAASSLVASDAAKVIFGSIGGGLIAILICFSVLGTTNSNVFTPPRMTFAMAHHSVFFKSAGKVHPRFQTPANAILIHWIVMVALVMSGSFFILTDMYIFMVWVFNLMLMVGLYVLRKKMPEKHRPFKVWGYPWMPALVIIFNLFYLVVTIVDDVSNYLNGKTPVMNSVFGLVVTAMGIPLYWYFRRRYGRRGA